MASVEVNITRDNGSSVKANGTMPDADVITLANSLAALLALQLQEPAAPATE